MNTWTMSRSSPHGPSDSNLSSEIQTPHGTFLIIKDLSTSALKMTKASVLPPSKSCDNEGEKTSILDLQAFMFMQCHPQVYSGHDQ